MSIQMLNAEPMPKNLEARPVPLEWHSRLPIFASEQYLKSVSSEYGWLGGTDGEGQVRCILPYAVMRKPGLRMVRFQTETIPLLEELELHEEKSFLTSAIEYFASIKADIIIPSGNTAIFRTYPDVAAAAPYGTVIMELTQPEETLQSQIRKTFRQNIRKAVSAGVLIKSGPEYLDISYELIAKTLRRSEVSFKSYEDFKHKISAFGENLKIFVAEHNGVVQGCMVSPFSEHTAYNCYAGSRVEPILGSMHLLHWEAIRQFRAMGVKRFDFQGVRINPEKGSKQAGILHYKQGFGGQLIQGYLWKHSLRPLKSMAYTFGVRLLQGGDIVDQEGGKLNSL
jgi:hypothetical protein